MLAVQFIYMIMRLVIYDIQDNNSGMFQTVLFSSLFLPTHTVLIKIDLFT